MVGGGRGGAIPMSQEGCTIPLSLYLSIKSLLDIDERKGRKWSNREGERGRKNKEREVKGKRGEEGRGKR